MTRILIVEDDANIRRGLEDLLASEGYDVVSAVNGHEGRAKALSVGADLVLLDIMLPGPDGYEILRAMRADNLATPVIFLSAKSQEIDKVLGFKLGADDYVVKPFGTAELLARITVRLKRPEETLLRKFTAGNIILDMVGSRLSVGGRDMPATHKEKELLCYLMRHRGEALSRQRLLDEIWGHGSESTTRTVDTHVFSLRKMIEKNPADPVHIQSVRGIGYRFESGS
ncbi:MAG: response regulator transcription factor [Planctomycetota bacterium]